MLYWPHQQSLLCYFSCRGTEQVVAEYSKNNADFATTYLIDGMLQPFRKHTCWCKAHDKCSGLISSVTKEISNYSCFQYDPTAAVATAMCRACQQSPCYSSLNDPKNRHITDSGNQQLCQQEMCISSTTQHTANTCQRGKAESNHEGEQHSSNSPSSPQNNMMQDSESQEKPDAHLHC